MTLGAGIMLIVFIIFFLGTIAIIVGLMGTFIWNKVRKLKVFNTIKKVVLVAKRMERFTAKTIQSMTDDVGGYRTSDKDDLMDYILTFEDEKKNRIELEVDVNEYNNLVEGTRGMLTFKGEQFISFERIYQNQ